MNHTIQALLSQISALEDELQTALHEQQSRIFLEIRRKRVEFERKMGEAHAHLRRSVTRWIVTDRHLRHGHPARPAGHMRSAMPFE